MRITLVVHNGFAALNAGAGKHIGGVERQTSLLARWLAARGHEVSVLTWDEGQGPEVEIDGVRIIAVCPGDAGLPGARFFYPRWWSLNRALETADAELYFHNGAEVVTGQVAMWCRRRGIPMVFAAASDLDCTAGLEGLPRWRERVLYRYGLRHADAVITQTPDQQRDLLDNYGLESTVLRMGAVDPFAGTGFDLRPERRKAGRVCWVGRLSPEKQLEHLFAVAGELPGVAFDVVGGASEDEPDYARGLIAQAKDLRNVCMHGRLNSEELARVYRGAAVLCCTSSYEGYPNVFIEAWAHGIPIVSTVDPGGVISGHGLGSHATTTEAIHKTIDLLLDDEAQWTLLAKNCRQFFEREHASDRAFAQFEALFSDVIDRRSSES